MQNYEERLNYHPDFFTTNKGLRNVELRASLICNVIKSKINNPQILEIGCSGGYFSFMMSKFSSHVHAIDIDSKLVENNRNRAESHSVKNISFECVSALEYSNTKFNYNTVVCMSVMHHLLAASAAYDNFECDEKIVLSKFNQIFNCAKLVIFEIGGPDEGYEWCERLPYTTRNTLNNWVAEKLFPQTEWNVQVVDVLDNLPCCVRSFTRYLLTYSRNGNFYHKILRLLFKIDMRDKRIVYIASKKTDK